MQAKFISLKARCREIDGKRCGAHSSQTSDTLRNHFLQLTPDHTDGVAARWGALNNKLDEGLLLEVGIKRGRAGIPGVGGFAIRA